MAQTVNWNTGEIIRDLLVNNSSQLTGDPNIKLLSGADNNSATNQSEPEIEIQEVDNRNWEEADVLNTSFDKNAFTYITISKKDGDMVLWREIIQILLENRTKGDGLPGGWDKITWDDLSAPPGFGSYDSTIRVQFYAYGQLAE